MRKILFATAFALSAFALPGASPSEAATGAWCSNTLSAMTDDCAFQTQAQCQTYISGQGGSCNRSVTSMRDAQARLVVPTRSTPTDAYILNSTRP